MRKRLNTLAEMRRETEVPVVFADRHGIITDVNAGFEACFGWSRQEIVGEPLTTIIPPNLRDAHNLGFSRFLSTMQPTLLGQPLELAAVNKAGDEFRAEHFIVAEQSGGAWQVGATIVALDD